MTTVYRYGALAWFWRALIGVAFLSGAVLGMLAVRLSAPVLAVIGGILVAPSLFFGLVVATRIVHDTDGRMHVHSLLFTRRTISRDQVGRARVRTHAQGTASPVYAPRAWLPVRGELPVYVDLLADLPERKAFADWWGVPVRAIPPRAR